MMSVRFEKLQSLNRKAKHTVFCFIRKSQQLLPKNNVYYNIVPLIQHICLLYVYQMLDSLILTDDEQNIFELLLNKNN